MGLNAHGCRVGHVRYACHNTICNFVYFSVNFLAASLFSTRFFSHACFVTDFPLFFCFWEGPRKAAHAKITRKGGRSRKKTKRTQSRDLQVMPRLLVIFACAASRWPSGKQKYSRKSVTAQARKNTKDQNNNKARIVSRLFFKITYGSWT